MLLPKTLTKLEKNKIVEIYTVLSQDLIKNIITKLQKNGNITEFTKNQIKTLARIDGNQIYKDTILKINGLSRKQKRAIIEIYNEIAKEQMKGYKGQYDYKEIPFELSKSQMQILETAINRTNKQLRNLTKTVAFETKRTYVKALDELYMNVVTGSFDYDSAIKKTVSNLSEKGITLTSKGRNYKLESMVKTSLMTSLTQTANDISKKTGEIIGADAVWIAPTPFCRPTHRVINGVTMDLKEFKKHEYLTEEPNCYHIVNYVIKDIFEPPYSNNELRKINSNANEKYEVRQKQNYYARQVREKKNEISNIPKKNNEDEITKKKKELRTAQEKYKKFSRANNLEIDYSSMFVAGYKK